MTKTGKKNEERKASPADHTRSKTSRKNTPVKVVKEKTPVKKIQQVVSLSEGTHETSANQLVQTNHSIQNRRENRKVV